LKAPSRVGHHRHASHLEESTKELKELNFHHCALMRLLRRIYKRIER